MLLKNKDIAVDTFRPRCRSHTHEQRGGEMGWGSITGQHSSEKASARLVQSRRADCPSEGPCSTQEPPSSAPSCLMLAGSSLGRPWPQHGPGRAAADGCPPATLLTAGPLKGSANGTAPWLSQPPTTPLPPLNPSSTGCCCVPPPYQS